VRETRGCCGCSRDPLSASPTVCEGIAKTCGLLAAGLT
jgi:hypothetical protein